MKLVCLDSTAVVPTGPGSPAFFSRYLIKHLRDAGHEVVISQGFNERLCAEADAVWTEWANEDAFAAAASGLCRRLIVRLRGFEAFGPLDKLEWSNVDALVYESPFLKQLVEEKLPGLRGFRSHVIPSGIDVDNIPFKTRKPGPVVALVARGVADKGYQLAFEWARHRPDIQLHVALALPEPRLLRYLEYTKPANVTIHPQVDTVKWLDEIDANYLLSASNWESLGYTIAEAMALGIKPLIHDTPGAELNWPEMARWLTLHELDTLVFHEPSNKMGRPPTTLTSIATSSKSTSTPTSSRGSSPTCCSARPRPAPPPSATGLILQVEAAIQSNQLEAADAWLLEFRDRTPRLGGLDDHRAGLALKLASAYVNAEIRPRPRLGAALAGRHRAPGYAVPARGDHCSRGRPGKRRALVRRFVEGREPGHALSDWWAGGQSRKRCVEIARSCARSFRPATYRSAT